MDHSIPFKKVFETPRGSDEKVFMDCWEEMVMSAESG
jgi:hypothetical protein